MEGKEIIGVVRKAVFKDKNGEKIPFPTTDGERCYLYIQYLDDYNNWKKDKKIKTIVVENLYFSEGSFVRLKYKDGKWHAIDELEDLSMFDILNFRATGDWFCFNDRAGGYNVVAAKVYKYGKYQSLLKYQYREQMAAINHQFGGTENKDFEQAEFIELINNIYNYLSFHTTLLRNYWFGLRDLASHFKEEEISLISLKEWISYVAFALDTLNLSRFWQLSYKTLSNDINSEMCEEELHNFISIVLQMRPDMINTPIYKQLLSELETKKDSKPRILEKRR